MDAEKPPIPRELRERILGYPQVAGTRDTAATSEMLTDDYTVVFVRPEVQVVTKADWLGLLPQVETREFTVLHEVISLQGENVATHHALVRMDTTMRGVERAGEFAMTDVWVREGDVWRMWQRHSVPLSASTLPV